MVPGRAREDAHDALAPCVTMRGRQSHARGQARQGCILLQQTDKGQALHHAGGTLTRHIAVAHPAPVRIRHEKTNICFRFGVSLRILQGLLSHTLVDCLQRTTLYFSTQFQQLRRIEKDSEFGLKFYLFLR